MDRRDFISILGGTVAAAMYSCKPPEQKIVPLVNPVEYMKPGAIDYISTVYCHGNVSYGALVKTYEGRPIKIEGNELHPINKCGTSPQMQASIYSLYDPNRFRKPRIVDKEVNIDSAIDYLKQKINSAIKNNEQIRIIIDEHCSPSFSEITRLIEKAYPNVKFITLPPAISHISSINQKLLGIKAEIVPDVSKVEYILSVGCDFLGTENSSLFHRNQFGKNRKNIRLITAESVLSLTGMNSDKRISLHPTEYESFLTALLTNIIVFQDLDSYKFIREKLTSLNTFKNEQATLYAIKLLEHQGSSAVLVGSQLSELSIALGIMINHLLKNYDKGMIFEPKYIIPESKNDIDEIKSFIHELSESKISNLVFLESDPCYFIDKEIRELFNKIKIENKYSVSLYPNETSQDCILDIPATHYLESWGDATNLDGSISIQQPVISPLNENSISKENLLIKIFNIDNKLFNNEQFTYYDFIKQNHKEISAYQSEWENLLRNGVKHNENQNSRKIILNIDNFINLIPKSIIKINQDKLYCQLHTSNNLLFGENSNIPYLYELPDPVTSQVWGNAALVNSNTSRILGINPDKTIIIDGVEIPVILNDNISMNTIALPLGFGQKINYHGQSQIGINAFKLRKNYFDSMYFPVEFKIGKNEPEIILSQLNYFSNKEIIQSLFIKQKKSNNSINPKYKYNSYRWGMVIDLAKCIGCNACVVACQIENNIPVVGKEEAKNGRLMHWIRHDKYNNKEFLSIPMLCQHCENAPCESVCPVSASTHSPEGLNETTYNRCIGARYCMANCPYKVRKFNFFSYNENIKKPLNMLLNPQVTVRMRGVVEKCTFCVQRINEAKYKAKDMGLKRIPDGQLKTACQQACPTGAIVFGDLNDTESQVYKLSKNERAIKLLDELNTNPSVVYLRKV